MKRKNFADDIDAVRAAIGCSRTIADALRRLGVRAAAVHYDRLKRVAAEHDIDMSHFVGQRSCTGRTFSAGPNGRPLAQVLVHGKYENTHGLKKRLLKDGVKKHECESCRRRTWLGNPMPLTLHHVDGDRHNNTIENLQLLCPNCHSLTDNFCGKKLKKKPRHCIKCGKEVQRRSSYCSAHWPRRFEPKPHKRKLQVPDTELREQLIDLVWKMPTQQIAKLYSVSDNAVAKWCRRLDIQKPGRGYWAKQYAKQSSRGPARSGRLPVTEETASSNLVESA